jgi:hypothetical protein
LMYTSCGWFFEDISGIETVQVIQYAGRAIQLCLETTGSDLEPEFLEHLSRAHSNLSEMGDGRNIFNRFVKPAGLDLEKVAAHYAVSSLFEDYPAETSIYCYSATQEEYRSAEVGKARLAVGRVAIASNITHETATFHFGVMHFGDHNLTCGIANIAGDEDFRRLQEEIFTMFEKADFPAVLRVQDEFLGASRYSLKSLFRDQQRRILRLIFQTAQDDAMSVYRPLYENYAPLMRFLKDSGTPPPRVLMTAGELVVNEDLRLEFSRDELDHDTIRNLIEAADLAGIPLDAETLEFVLRHKLQRLAEEYGQSPEKMDLPERMVAGMNLVYALPFHVNLRKAQNIQYDLNQRIYPVYREKAAQGDADAGKWLEYADALNEKLLIKA